MSQFDTYQVNHEFVDATGAVNLFKGTTTLRQFKSKLAKLSRKLPQDEPVRWGSHVDMRENEKKILGDGFELFIELFVLHFGYHPHIGLAEYRPNDPESDTGIDGYAVNLNNERVAVQCKYKSNETEQLTANKDHLANFLNAAMFEDINWREDTKIKRLFLFTTAEGLHYFTDDTMFRNRVKTIANKDIKQLVDNNLLFWQSCEKIMEQQNN
jgi:hypothetical protein